MPGSLKLYRLFVLVLILIYIENTGAQPKKEEVQSGYKGGYNTQVKTQEHAVNFIVVGDWGRNGEFYQTEVAEQMSKTAATIDADFIVSVGDNFYPSGVQSTTDPNWSFSFENIYKAYYLHCDWYVALGNHDYKGNIQAQIDYSSISRRWHIPSPYYSQKIRINDSSEILLVIMDTNPFIDSYYKKEDKLKENIIQQDTTAQRLWLEKTLSDTSSSIKWRLVVGHHPMYSGGKRKKNADTDAMKNKFQAFFDSKKVDAYICGHEHDLQIIKPGTHYTTQYLSGSGCEVRPTGTTEGSTFAASEPGFMCFSVNEGKMMIQVVHVDGTVIYNQTIQK